MKHMVRSVTAVMLTVCMAVVSLPLTSVAGDVPLRITVAADTHFQCAADLGEPGDEYTEYLLEPELYGYASTQGQMNYESEAILSRMLEEFAASDSECLLIAGDLTCGKRQSHSAFAAYLKRAEEESGKRIFVINGNHDCDSESSDNGISMEEFREIYADFGYDEALARHESSASYTVDLSDRYRLIAIDSCIYGEDDGKIGSSVFRWIKEQTEQAERDGREMIAMMHHSILPHYELQPMIDLWQYYAGWFADHGIRTVLTGHIHANDIASTVSDRGNVLYDVQTGALISSPNTYRVLTLEEDKTDVRSRFITEIDPSLLPAQLTESQKAAVADDFSGYAKEYFISGVCKWMNRNIGSVNRLARWFKLKEGTAAYTAAEDLMRTLGAAVGQDIYDTGSGPSIEAALAQYGVDVPRSDYRKPYQVAAKLMYGFFRGDEDPDANRSDTQLLLTCLEGALLTTMRSGTDNDSLSALMTAVSGRAASAPIPVMMRQTAEKIALALAETLAGGFIDDYSAPPDLNVTLTFEAPGEMVTLHPIVRFLRLMIEMVKRLFVVHTA